MYTCLNSEWFSGEHVSFGAVIRRYHVGDSASAAISPGERSRGQAQYCRQPCKATTVFVNETAARLLFVSPQQINAEGTAGDAGNRR